MRDIVINIYLKKQPLYFCVSRQNNLVEKKKKKKYYLIYILFATKLKKFPAATRIILKITICSL
jgi:hypothetical protein